MVYKRAEAHYAVLALFAIIVMSIGAGPARGWPTVFPTGTTCYKPDKSYNGYVLFVPLETRPNGMSVVYLVKMGGEVVHRWKVPFPVLSAQLLANGNLVICGTNSTHRSGRPGIDKYWIGGAAGWLAELDWEGRGTFKHADLNMHHEACKLSNGHYLYLAWERVPPALQAKVRGGYINTEFPGPVMFNDVLVEIDGHGKKVWQWHANAHLDPAVDVIGPTQKRQEWLHCNSVAPLKNGNVLLTSRSCDEMLEVERRSGKIVRRWGNAAYYDKKRRSIEYRFGPQNMGGPHNGMEIPAGLPGAGHWLCFDNGLYTYSSRAVEVEPATSKLVWSSEVLSLGRKEFSWFTGSAQRLPNGNTLICDGANGRLYQQSPSKEIVWEYINPFLTAPLLKGAMLKAALYPPSFCPQFAKLPEAAGEALAAPPNEKLRIAAIAPPALDGSKTSPRPILPLYPTLGVVGLLVGLLVWRRRLK